MRKLLSLNAVLIMLGLGLVLGAASTPVGVEQTVWNIPMTRINIRIAGFGRVLQREFGSLDLMFGPGNGLEENGFLAIDDEGMRLEGTYTLGRGKRIALDWDQDVLEEFVKSKIRECTRARDVEIEITRERTRLNYNTRPRNRMQLTMVVSYEATGIYNGNMETARGWYQLRGVGEPSDY